jgi:DNA polymerase V
VLSFGYDVENLKDPQRRREYAGSVTTDPFGRSLPKYAHGTANLKRHTSSAKLIVEAVSALCERIADKNLLVRRINIAATHVVKEASLAKTPAAEQLSLFGDDVAERERREREEAELEREQRIQRAVLSLKKKYGKNAVLKGVNFEEGATARNRNEQIGGHRA